MSTAFPAYLLPLLHFAALAGLGALVRSRLLVLFAAVVGIGWLVLTTHPADLVTKPAADLATSFGGVVLGAITGLWAVGARDRRASAERIARDVAAGRPPSKSSRRTGPGAAGWVGVTLLVALCAAVGLYVEGRTVPQWRTMVDGWRDSPTARSMGLAPVPTSVAAGAANAAPKGGAAAAPTRARAEKGDRAAANPGGGAAAPPQGDLRHCLERGGTQDVLRCAEQRR